jgi:DNA-binding transcriptional MerR regulator
MREKNYKSISEVSILLNLNPHVVRYWDKKFNLSTRLNSNNKRFFNNNSIKKLKQIKTNMYSNGKNNYSLDLADKLISAESDIRNGYKSNNFVDNNEIIILKNLRKISKNLRKLIT